MHTKNTPVARPFSPRRGKSTFLFFAATGLLLAQGCSPAADEQSTPGTSQIDRMLATDPGLEQAISGSRQRLMALRASLGLPASTTFRARSVVPDQDGSRHIRFDQLHNGVRVWAGDAIVAWGVREASGQAPVITSLHAGIDIETRPALSREQALSRAEFDLRPRGEYASTPTVELVIYPDLSPRAKEQRLRGPEGELNAEDMEQVLNRYALAYHIHTELENAEETRHTDYLVDAKDGSILKSWNTLHTASATGTGKSQYSGTVSITTETAGTGFELRDTSRSMPMTTYNLNGGTSGTGMVFTDPDNTWGDGKNFVAGSPTTSDNGQTAGVDAHFGGIKTSDYYKIVHGRNGIDGAGKATYSRVHYSTRYDNAFWTDTCFCMTYGDGSSLTVLTAIDVAGHEMTHGVTANTAKLIYSGESGGLNEAMSDIHGTMVEFYARGGSGSVIGETGGNWLIGEQILMPALRYMQKPSKDSRSKDAWSSTLGSIDVHYSSGPLNRAFYFLSQGASSVVGNDAYSSYLPGGMSGIGNDKSARIAFRALATKMTASTNYAGARTAFLAATTDLYGATGAEYAAVQNAFAAINVGTPAGGGDMMAPTASLTAPTAGSTVMGTVTVSANAMDNVGVTKVDFFDGATLIASDATAPYSVSWNTVGKANGGHSLTAKAYDAAGNVGTSPAVNVTVNNGGGGDTMAPTASLTAPTAGSTVMGAVTVSANAMDNVGVTKVDFFDGATLIASDATAPYSVSWNTAAVGNGMHSLTAKAYDAAGNVGTSTAVNVTVNNMGGMCRTTQQLVLNSDFEGGVASWAGDTGVITNTVPTHAHAGTYVAWLGGNGRTSTENLYQQVTIPADACSAAFSFWQKITTDETGSTAYDRLTVTVQNSTGTVLRTLATYSNVGAGTTGTYVQRTFDLAAYKGQTVRLHFKMTEDSVLKTSFYTDDVTLTITK